jgi:hypothetical protein
MKPLLCLLLTATAAFIAVEADAPAGPVAVAVQGVTSAGAENIIWGLEMRPAQTELDADPAGTDVLYNLTWSKTAAKV